MAQAEEADLRWEQLVYPVEPGTAFRDDGAQVASLFPDDKMAEPGGACRTDTLREFTSLIRHSLPAAEQSRLTEYVEAKLNLGYVSLVSNFVENNLNSARYTDISYDPESVDADDYGERACDFADDKNGIKCESVRRGDNDGDDDDDDDDDDDNNKCGDHGDNYGLNESIGREILQMSADIYGNSCTVTCQEKAGMFAVTVGESVPRDKQDSSNPWISDEAVFQWNTAADGRRFVSCPVCQRTFYKLHTVIAHHASHTGEKPFVCSVCAKKFASSSSLRTHTHTHKHAHTHSRRRPRKKRASTVGKWFGCAFCGAGFVASGQLRLHRCGAEGVQRKCPGCGRSYKCSGALSLHMRLHCASIRGYVCHLCGKAYQCKDRLAEHRVRHAGSHPYSCLACGSWFKSTEGLNKHSVKHSTEQGEHVYTVPS